MSALENEELFKIELFKLRVPFSYFTESAQEIIEDISNEHWLKIIQNFEKTSYSSLSMEYLLKQISEVCEHDYAELISAVTRKNPQRQSRPQQTTALPIPRRYRSRHTAVTAEDKENNPLIINDRGQFSKEEREKIKATGAKLNDTLSSPRTDATTGIQSRHTPQGSRYRLFYRAAPGSAYKKATPEAKTGKRAGRAKPQAVSEEALRTLFTRFSFARPEIVECTVSLPDVVKKTARVKGQKALVGASSRELFEAHGVETFVKPQGGSYYHLYHIIGLCVGGEHSAKYIVPTTARANYTCLQLIESYITSHLLSGKTDEVAIKATLNYPDGSYIPNSIQYTISWNETIDGKVVEQQEEIPIMTCSYETLSPAARETIETFRNIEPRVLEF